MGSEVLEFKDVASHLIYLVSVVVFMLGIMRMSRVKTARWGNQMAAGAMFLACIGQAIELGMVNWTFIIVGVVVGGLVGGLAASRVEMTEMPEMVALFNGSGGIASSLVAIASYMLLVETRTPQQANVADQITAFNGVALGLTILVGAITFTGSIVAWGKLSGRLSGNPTLLPGRHLINGALFLAAFGATGVMIFTPDPQQGLMALVVICVTTCLLGIGLVIPIGGGDMPVVISLLNSYSGMAAALAGFTINSPVLIVSGSMVGAAGLILTQIMCKAMNRSLMNVLIGGFGQSDGAGSNEDARLYTNVKRADAEEAAMILEDARTVIVVPGYGMAVAQAQHAVREMADLLGDRGCQVRYAIHPVAGRMPGHMNVLLAEADVPYEAQVEMERINKDFKNTDVAIVIGANDVVNPVANTDTTSPIYGMPVLNVEEAGTVFVIKRSLSPGYAGIRNPLFEAENTLMLFGDGKAMVEGMSTALKEADD